jgi:4-hydroxy-tetrahydrodipicolinate synthase
MKTIAGPIFAIVTPFQANGDIDFTALDHYLSFLQEKGVETILANGTTAEFPSLSLAERMTLLQHCRQWFQGTLLNNVSSCCLSDSFTLIDHSTNYADALVTLPPYYYAHSPEPGILSFFRAILQHSSSLPVYLYHFPKHTQNIITPSMVEILLKDYDHLVGIKDSEANLETALKFKTCKMATFQVFVGGDKLALEGLKQGLNGSVTGGGNPFPELLVSLFRSFQAGDLTTAALFQSYLDRWSQFRKQNDWGEIAITKIALRTRLGPRLQNFPTFVRPPLQMLEPSKLATVESFMQQMLTVNNEQI